MHITKNEIPVKIDVPGAIARQATDFGCPSGIGALGAEYLSLGAGTDIAPLLKGLEGDACQSPHWGYMLSGEVVITYTNDTQETCSGNDLFYWPPGHSVRVRVDSEVILFSPEVEHSSVMAHMLAQMGGG
jgi:hypothetical protein